MIHQSVAQNNVENNVNIPPQAPLGLGLATVTLRSESGRVGLQREVRGKRPTRDRSGSGVTDRGHVQLSLACWVSFGCMGSALGAGVNSPDRVVMLSTTNAGDQCAKDVLCMHIVLPM